MDILRYIEQNKDLLSKVSPDEFSAAVAQNNALVWTKKYRVLRGKPMRFVDFSDPHRHRPFLEMPLSFEARHKTAVKPRQIGYSEISLSEVEFNADTKPGTKWLYSFPRDRQLQRFSKTRITPSIDESPYLKSRTKGGQDNVYLKQIGNSFIVLTSAWDPEMGEGTDADGVYFDEKDRMRPKIETAFEESLSSSRYRYRRDISTPTLPGRGVDETFQQSTQFYWFVKCKSCGARQYLERANIFEVKRVPLGATNFEDGSYEYRCTRCKDGELDRWNGVWVPKYANKDIAGWSLSQLMCVWISADDIMRKRLKYKHEDLWVRYVLGQPYSEGGGLCSFDHVMACAVDPSYNRLCSSRPNGIRAVAAGIDWGTLNWVVIMGVSLTGRLYILDLQVFADTKEPLEQVQKILAYLSNWNPDIVTADFGYGKDRNPVLLKVYGDRFFACHYPNTEDTTSSLEPKWNLADHTVTAHRSTALKQTAYLFRNKGIVVPGPGSSGSVESQVKILGEHWSNCQTVRDEEDDGTIVERIESAGPDHYAHATTYARLGAEKISNRGVSRIYME